MASESAPPAPPGGGNLKYAIIGVVLIGASIAVWFGMQSCEEPTPPPTAEVAVDAGPGEEPPPEDLDLILPDELPDAGVPEDAAPRIRYVTRYVGGGGGGNWSCSGDIDQAAASRAIREHNLQFRNCYERRLKVNQTLAGRVQLQVKVGRDGSVDGVRTGGSLRDAQVLSCVRGIAQRIRFPRPTGGCAVVAVPFDFTPRE